MWGCCNNTSNFIHIMYENYRSPKIWKKVILYMNMSLNTQRKEEKLKSAILRTQRLNRGSCRLFFRLIIKPKVKPLSLKAFIISVPDSQNVSKIETVQFEPIFIAMASTTPKNAVFCHQLKTMPKLTSIAFISSGISCCFRKHLEPAHRIEARSEKFKRSASVNSHIHFAFQINRESVLPSVHHKYSAPTKWRLPVATDSQYNSLSGGDTQFSSRVASGVAFLQPKVSNSYSPAGASLKPGCDRFCTGTLVFPVYGGQAKDMKSALIMIPANSRQKGSIPAVS